MCKLFYHFEHWTMLIVSFFFVLVLSVFITTEPANSKKSNSRIFKKHDQISINVFDFIG